MEISKTFYEIKQSKPPVYKKQMTEKKYKSAKVFETSY